MGLFYEIGWVVYDGGLVVHADNGDCERYARQRGLKPTVWRGGPDPIPPVLDGRCHYCRKQCAGTKYHTVIYGREFCHLSCADGWREEQRLNKIADDREKETREKFGVPRARPRY